VSIIERITGKGDAEIDDMTERVTSTVLDWRVQHGRHAALR
jgi:hypothetical protein